MGGHAMARGQGRTVAVFGAAGHTGRFVIAELLNRGFTPVAVGRDRAKLADLQHCGIRIGTASVEDAASLDTAFAGAAAIVNCAGPFLETAGAVVAAALRARIPYFDVTAEQASAQATFERFDAAARDAGIVIVPAMGFFGGLGDLLATAAIGNWDCADEICVGVALDRWWPTLGTRVTGRRNTAPRLVIVDGKLTAQTLPASELSWNFPEPFGLQHATEVPLSEIVLIARHLRASHIHTYLNSSALRDVQDPGTPPPAPADELGRSPQIFLVDVIVRKEGCTRRAIAQGRDIYAFTAPLVVEAVQRILDGQAHGTGALTPGEVFDAKDTLQALSPEHLRFDIRNG